MASKNVELSETVSNVVFHPSAPRRGMIHSNKGLQMVIALVVASPVAVAQEGSCTTRPPTPKPGPDGWGPVWQTDLEGEVVPTLTIRPLAIAYEHTVRIRVRGVELDTSWIEGPFIAWDDTPLSLPVELPIEAASQAGLVQVLVRVTARDPASGVEAWAASADRVYVANAGSLLEAWLSESTATALAVQAAPASNSSSDGETVVDVELVGAEVEP